MELDVNELLERAKEAANTVARETGKAVCVQKKRLNAAGLHSRLNRAYETLGRAYFASLKNETESAALTKALEQVEDLTEQWNRAKEELAEEKDQRLCPSCGAAVELDAAFCKHCGASLG